MQEIEPGPDHGSMGGESVKITTGCRLVVEFENRGFKTRFENRNFYWKHGMSHEAHRWLKNAFGPQCLSRARWDNQDMKDGQWLYLGTQIRKKGAKKTVTLQFRTPAQALLFKLTWGGRL